MSHAVHVWYVKKLPTLWQHFFVMSTCRKHIPYIDPVDMSTTKITPLWLSEMTWGMRAFTEGSGH